MYNNRSQRGQSMAEYMVLYPVAVGVAIAASILGAWLYQTLSYAVDEIDPTNVCRALPEQEEGPDDNTSYTDSTFAGDHAITLTGTEYDEGNDVTRVTYTVYSGASPSISHWTLGLDPDSVDFISASEGFEWTASDPTTGTAGIKFDTGYEANESEEEEDNGPPANRGRSKISVDFRILWPSGEDFAVSRDITLMFSGQYDFESTDASIKAGQEVEYTSILAPVRIKSEEEQGNRI